MPPIQQHKQLSIVAKFSELTALRDFIYSSVAAINTPQMQLDTELIANDLALAAHEICANIIDHAYGGEGNNPITAILQHNPIKQRIEIRLEDNGRSYNPKTLDWPPSQSWHTRQDKNGTIYLLDEVPEPDILQERGRGVYLLTLLAEHVTYRPSAGSNIWCLSKSY